MMKFKLVCISVFLSIYFTSHGQWSDFIFDDFTDSTARIDLSTKIIRSGYTEPVTAFEIIEKADENQLNYQAIHIGDEGLGKGGYSFSNGDYMTHTCIDYHFPQEIDRSDEDTIRFEFDALFASERGSGESNRMVIHIMHSYPGEDPLVGDYLLMDGHPFGRPAYNVRILPGSYGMFMAYGGGDEEMGTFEISSEMWLPGFSSSAGGTTIGQGDKYPVSSWNEVDEGTETYSTTIWKHYTLELTYDRLSVYWRNSESDEENNELLLFMEMPENGDIDQINSAHGTFVGNLPTNYHWFEFINGLRFYWRASEEQADIFLANVKASKTGEPITTYAEFNRKEAKIIEDAANYNIKLDVYNVSEENPTSVIVSLISGDSAIIDNFSSDTTIFPAGDDASQNLSLNILSDDDDISDTLVFEIMQIQGGELPVVGENRTFTLVVDDITTSTKYTLSEGLRMYPNPAKDYIQVKHDFLKEARLIIYTINGVEVFKNDNFTFMPVDISSLQEGFYIICLENKQERLFRRMVIQK